ncbi:MAG: L-threonine ammonia-lyase [Polyangiaceae bacterium]|jgi:threonine dehydratase|nr:L-threonine ammonia-lyase [Polyangiaceae bacterium]
MSGEPLTYDDVQRAQARISGRVRRTPLSESAALSRLAGCQVFLKLENLQFTGSFKERGAASRLLSLDDAERARGVITASAGNHAQAVALHASRLGVVATVVMPEATPLVKVRATEGFGARVLLHGAGYDAAAERAAELAAESGAVYVHPFDDLQVMAGQGTIGLELLEQLPDFDALVVPVGGGGLIAGIATAVRPSRPNARIIGVESRTFPGMRRALESEAPRSLPPPALPGGKTIADGIAVRRVGQLPRQVVRALVDEIVLVDEEEIAEAILLLLERERTVAEGAGAVGLAALLHRDLGLSGQRVVVVVSGGNIDVNLMARVIQRGLVKSGRLCRFWITASDVAGTLHGITGAVAAARANIVSIEHDRAFADLELGQTRVELVIETNGPDHVALVEKSLRDAGFEPGRD